MCCACQASQHWTVWLCVAALSLSRSLCDRHLDRLSAIQARCFQCLSDRASEQYAHARCMRTALSRKFQTLQVSESPKLHREKKLQFFSLHTVFNGKFAMKSQPVASNRVLAIRMAAARRIAAIRKHANRSLLGSLAIRSHPNRAA